MSSIRSNIFDIGAAPANSNQHANNGEAERNHRERGGTQVAQTLVVIGRALQCLVDLAADDVAFDQVSDVIHVQIELAVAQLLKAFR